jgi:hypothetical protein
MTEPPDETKAGASISVRGYFRFSSMSPHPDPDQTVRLAQNLKQVGVCALQKPEQMRPARRLQMIE